MRRATALIFIALSGLMGGQVKPRILISPFTAADAAQKASAVQLTELLESNIGGTNVFEIIDYKSAIAKYPEAAAAEDPEDEALSLAEASGADFLILCRSAIRGSDQAGTFTLNPMIRAISAGQEIQVSPSSFSDADKIPGMRDLSKKVINAINGRQDVSIAQIDALIKAEDFVAAENFAAVFKRAHADASSQREIASRQETIDQRLAEEQAGIARNALKHYLFDEARIAIKAALARAPSSVEYKGIAIQIETEAARRSSENAEKVIADAEELLSRRQYGAALDLLDFLNKRSPNLEKTESLRETARRGAMAQENYTKALASLAAGDFSAARHAIDESVSAFPDDPEFLNLKEKIESREKAEFEGREILRRYKAELDFLSPTRIFVERKRVSTSAVAGLRSLTASFHGIEESAYGWSPSVFGPSLAIEAWYERPFLRPLRYSLESADLGISWFAGARMAYISNDPENSGSYAIPYTVIDSNAISMTEAIGGVLARGEFLSFTADLGLEAYTGSVLFQHTVQAPFIDLTRTRTSAGWDIGLGVRLGASWIPIPGVEIRLDYRWASPFLLGLQEIEGLETEGLFAGMSIKMDKVK